MTQWLKRKGEAVSSIANHPWWSPDTDGGGDDGSKMHDCFSTLDNLILQSNSKWSNQYRVLDVESSRKWKYRSKASHSIVHQDFSFYCKCVWIPNIGHRAPRLLSNWYQLSEDTISVDSLVGMTEEQSGFLPAWHVRRQASNTSHQHYMTQ